MKPITENIIEDENEEKAIIEAAIVATMKANEDAKKTGLPMCEIINGKLYSVKSNGEKEFIKDIKPNTMQLPSKFKLI